MKRIVFLTGTRADYGKIKPLLAKLNLNKQFEVVIVVTGMHLLSQYGSTFSQIKDDALGRIVLLPNQNGETSMEHALANTITVFSDFLNTELVDLVVVHGDRVEALAGAIVGALRNTPVAHIEGGEVSGTVDGVIRHSISKLANLHFVANESAQKRLLQLGENPDSIYVIGSPDIDVMISSKLPSLLEVKQRYAINFEKYAILIFHPVTNEYDSIQQQARNLVDAILESTENFVVISPNNDLGTKIVRGELNRLKNIKRVIEIPSMRFEFFLTLLKNSLFIVGNSSAGIREAGYYGVPTINIGSRQEGRHTSSLIMNIPAQRETISHAFEEVLTFERLPISGFGEGNSAELFFEILTSEHFWPIKLKKRFFDLEV